MTVETKEQRQMGFTLVEILVVLGILAGLMAVFLPNVFESGQKANVKTAKLKLANVSKAINTFYSDCDQLPDSLEQLVEEPGEDVCESWGPNAYIDEKELLDPWKNDIIYEKTSSGFKLKSLGADGAENGDGFNKDIEL